MRIQADLAPLCCVKGSIFQCKFTYWTRKFLTWTQVVLKNTWDTINTYSICHFLLFYKMFALQNYKKYVVNILQLFLNYFMNLSEADSNRYVPHCLFSVMKSAKDQLISKCLFGVFNSHKKGTETIQHEIP